MDAAVENAQSLPALPLRDRIAIWGMLAALTALAWIYLAMMPMTVGALGRFGVVIAYVTPAGWQDAAITFLMWAVMMVAMMLPSASPMIMVYSRIAHSRAPNSWMHGAILFAVAYFAIWSGFSAIATAAQIGLQHAALLSGMLVTKPILGAIVLAAAGVYQFTPFKNACLSQCRSPIGFFMTEWREGPGGTFRMGLKHAVLCVGCCWMLMALLFVAGVMNLAWVAAIAALVLLEKVAPWGDVIASWSGVAFIVSAVVLAFCG